MKNILIIGLGSIGKKHVKAIQEQGIAAIYAWRSSAQSTPVEGVISIFALDEIPTQLDAVLIANPTSLHGQAMQHVLPLGVPIFLEKPPFPVLQLAQTLNQLCQDHQLLPYVGFPPTGPHNAPLHAMLPGLPDPPTKLL